MDRTFRLSIMALVAALVLGLAACGDDDDDDDGGGGGGGGERAGESIKAGLVTDIGGLNDRSFNALANKGLEDAPGELGVDTRVLISKSNGDYVPNLTTLAQQQSDLIVPVGFLMADATNTVATKVPTRTSRSSTSPPAASRTSPRTCRACSSRSRRRATWPAIWPACGRRTTTPRRSPRSAARRSRRWTTTSPASRPAPRRRTPGIETLNGYSQDFVDQAKCKEIALDQIAKGSKVVFQVAGQCGLGALDAAKEKGVQGIGVDADQAYLGDHILTSALKKVDVAVYNAIKRAQDGTFKGGTDVLATVENGGVGLGKIGAEGSKYADQVQEIQDQIAAGEITDIPDTVK